MDNLVSCGGTSGCGSPRRSGSAPAVSQAPEGYERFDKREGGWTEVLLEPAA